MVISISCERQFALFAGVKSTLGRIFGGKKDKLKSMRNDGGFLEHHRQGNPYVTAPISNSPSGSFTPVQVMQQQQLHYSNTQQQQMSLQQHNAPYQGGGLQSGSQQQQNVSSDCEIPTSDSMAGGLGSIAGKGDFDRRRKKKLVQIMLPAKNMLIFKISHH